MVVTDKSLLWKGKGRDKKVWEGSTIQLPEGGTDRPNGSEEKKRGMEGRKVAIFLSLSLSLSLRPFNRYYLAHCTQNLGVIICSGRPSTVSASNNQTMFGQLIDQNSSGFECLFWYFGQNIFYRPKQTLLAKTIYFGQYILYR